MPHVTLVSDLSPTSDWKSFDQLVSLSHLLQQSGHQVSLWINPEARQLDCWPNKSERLSPCPTWSSFEAIKSIPFWMNKKTDVLHFVPNLNSSRTRSHAFAWLVPVLKGFHNPLVVSSFYSWPQKPTFQIRQLLYLSDLVFTPSDYLRHLISSDPHSRNFQSFSQIPILPHFEEDDNEDFNYERLIPFVYMPGNWEEWEDPQLQFEKVLQSLSGWNGTLVVGQDWTSKPWRGKALSQLIQEYRASVFFPEKLNAASSKWLSQNAKALITAGLRLNSLSLSQSIEEALKWETPLLFSKLQSDLHSPHIAKLWSDLSSLKPQALKNWLEDDSAQQKLRSKISKIKRNSLQVDPVNQINRMYSLCFSKRA